MASGKDLDLLLVGKTGNGLSSTWKSITLKDDVEIRGGWSPVTPTCQVGQVSLAGREIRVIDTPGVAYKNQARTRLIQNALLQECKNKSRFSEGFNAIVLVISYSSRFNEEYTDVMNTLTSVLGDGNWLKSHGVVVVSSGDNFERDCEGMNVTFEGWCRQQRGLMGQILKDCDHRCVLFNNVTKDSAIVHKQRQELISAIDRMEYEGKARFVIGSNADWLSKIQDAMNVMRMFVVDVPKWAIIGILFVLVMTWNFWTRIFVWKPKLNPGGNE